MLNYEKALQIEQEYISLLHDTDAKNAFNVQDKLSEVGYTLESFSKAKAEYWFKNNIINCVHINASVAEDITSKATEAFADENNTLLYQVSQKPLVYHGNDEYNKQYCLVNDIPIVELGYQGGTIVTSTKDVGLLFFLYNAPSEVYIFVLNKLAKLISKQINNVTLIDNDILVNGYKVVGSAIKQFGNLTCLYFQISFEVDINLINTICMKKMIKQPKGLSDFANYTKDDLYKELAEWLRI